MKLHKLYGDWAQMKSEVVKAASSLMEDLDNTYAVMLLQAALIAEKDARRAFEVAFEQFKREER